jgi:hypothetical protein
MFSIGGPLNCRSLDCGMTSGERCHHSGSVRGIERTLGLSIPQVNAEWKHCPPLVIPSAAEGPAVQRT